VNDDWRLRIVLHDEEHANALTKRLEATELEHDLERSFHDRVIVSRDGSEVFCYAGTREQAERVAELVRSLAQEHDWHAEFELKRWHPTAEEWEDPDAPLPQSEAEVAAEHEELIEAEREGSQALGIPEWEVRVELPSHGAAVELAARLRDEGIPNVRRSKYLVVGALDEDSADAVAERIRRAAPPGSTVVVEGTPGAVRAELPPNPFAVFGGLGA
jgi:hypothetical protein